MTSIRHNGSTATTTGIGIRPDNRAALLAAARDSVLAAGVRRTTLVEVARRAGVSRMTAYRAFPDVQALVVALMTEELGSAIEEATRLSRQLPTGRERLVASAVAVARAIPDNALFRRVV